MSTTTDQTSLPADSGTTQALPPVPDPTKPSLRARAAAHPIMVGVVAATLAAGVAFGGGYWVGDANATPSAVTSVDQIAPGAVAPDAGGPGGVGAEDPAAGEVGALEDEGQGHPHQAGEHHRRHAERRPALLLVSLFTVLPVVAAVLTSLCRLV